MRISGARRADSLHSSRSIVFELNIRLVELRVLGDHVDKEVIDLLDGRDVVGEKTDWEEQLT